MPEESWLLQPWLFGPFSLEVKHVRADTFAIPAAATIWLELMKSQITQRNSLEFLPTETVAENSKMSAMS